ncbi:MAG: type II secretion system protein GspG, partial [Betaproteobacteria bacterium]|nr:type II secretion system protein GspG [Betaproteobacteria bacterium]
MKLEIPNSSPDVQTLNTTRPLSPCPAKKQRGFTLIELMVVLAIIGILAALVVPSVLGRADDARVTAARTDVGNLAQALKLYKLDNQRFPTAEQGLQALVVKPSAEPVPTNWKSYLDKLPA